MTAPSVERSVERPSPSGVGAGRGAAAGPGGLAAAPVALFEHTMRTAQTAAMLGVDQRTVLRWAEEGRLARRVAKSGRGWMFCADQVQAVKKQREVAAAADRVALRRADARAYQKALYRLRDRHPEEFFGLYAATRQVEREAVPACCAGTASDQTREE